MESVIARRVPVLWITGPGGVGKSTVSWHLFDELAREGIHIAFADSDQLGMCYPAPPGDPTRERVKAQNVGALIPRYRAAGARCVIVNGCLDPAIGLDAELMPEADVTICRLRADLDEIARRFTGRDGTSGDRMEVLKETLEEAEAMDAHNLGDVCVETTGVDPAEVAALVREACRDWPGFSGQLYEPEVAGGADFDGGRGQEADPACGGRADHAAEDVLLICGPTGVGKSTIGFELYLRCLRAGLTAGYIDLDQIGFVRPRAANDPDGYQLKAGNLAAMWRTYRSAGATRLIASGPIAGDAALQTYIRALPAGRVTVCRLHASAAELTRRIMTRGGGGSWPQPGDPLRGQPVEFLNRVAERAIADASALERAGIGTFRIDTDGRTAAQSADLISAAIGEPVRSAGCDQAQ